MSRNCVKFIVCLVLLFTFSTVNAQSPCPPTNSGPCPPPSAPIDGGVMVMLAIGAAYAVKKLKNNR